MPNGIQYSTGATPAGCLRKGNMLISNNTADTGTSFYTGVNPPAGGYTIYLNKASGGPSIYCPANDTQLVSITNQIAGANYTTAAQCLDYFAGQSDKLCVNFNYEGIVTNGLVLNLDAGFNPSYPTTGTTWYDLSGNAYNGTLINGPTFNSANSGSITLDGTNDYVNIPFTGNTSQNYTFIIFMKCNNMAPGDRQTLFGLSQNGNPAYQQFDIEIWNSSGVGFRGNGSSGEGVNFFYYGWNINSTVTNINCYAVTLYSTGQKIYVNGTLSTTLSQIITADFNSITLGVRGSAGNYWNGQCYYFSAYNRILTDSEIQQNFNALRGRYGI